MADEEIEDTLDLDKDDDTTAGEAAPDKAAAPADEPEAKPAKQDPPADDDDITALRADVKAAIEQYGADDPIVKSLQRSLNLAEKQAEKLKDVEPVVQDKKQEQAWQRFEKEQDIAGVPAHVKPLVSRATLAAKLEEYTAAARNDPDYAGDENAISAVATHRLKNYIRKAKREPAPVKEVQKKAKEQGREHRTPTGARLTPPGGAGGGRAPAEPTSPEDEFAQVVRNAGGRFDPSER